MIQESQRAHTRSPGGSSVIQSLAARYFAVRMRTERLCEPLSPEDCVVQSMTEASPLKWHLAHTSWFFETFVLDAAIKVYRAFDPAYAYLFNSYYNSVGERVLRSNRGMLTRPSLDEVRRYREHVDAHMRKLFEGGELVEGDALASVIETGIHHEQQHQELMLTDLKHLFASNPLLPAYRPNVRVGTAEVGDTQPGFLPYEEGLHWIGHEGSGFAFDNETPRHRVFDQAFELAARAVTNAEFLEFIEDRGYARAELWLSEGWDAVGQNRWEAPLYWQKNEGQWTAFTLCGMRDLVLDEPVTHVSYYEADAFARWAGARLPRESEWEHASAGLEVKGNFAESDHLHPAPTRSIPARQPAAMFGDVWEWTQSSYLAYPGYRTPPGALGEYNGKFMCNQFVLRGGSCVSPQSHLRSTYRNFFPPAARWQFSGIRLAR